jgi:putative flippase GtrA
MSASESEPRRLARFGIAGAINTIVGVTVIFALTVVGMAPALANATGYAAGFVLSFALSRRFVFRSARSLRSALPLFTACFAAAFALNQAVLHAALRILDASAIVAQSLAVTTYIVVMYLLQRFVVFRAPSPDLR